MEQFLKKVLRLPYLQESPEFKLFVHAEEKVDKDGKKVEVSKQIEEMPS